MSETKPSHVSGVTACAGAKVLITGGYLVLEKGRKGIVLSVNARLYSSLYTSSTARIANPDGSFTVPICVLTPQRTRDPLYMSLHYTKHDTSDEGNISPYTFEITGDTDANTFVAKTLLHGFIAVSSLLTPEQFHDQLANGLVVLIKGDRSFYSANALPATTPVEIGEIDTSINPDDYTTKTGLGSSAALVSSLISAMFAYFKLLKYEDVESLDSISLSPNDVELYAYRISQLAHCSAQGKVGSGFDVAAAFYGTHIYSRFSPSIIQSLLDSPPERANTDLQASAHPYSDPDRNMSIIEATHPSYITWDDIIEKFTLPKGFTLLLGDVSGGSETPSMVKKVLGWLKTAERSTHPTLWNDLDTTNGNIEQGFLAIDEFSMVHADVYAATVQVCSKLPQSQWNTDDTITQITNVLEDSTKQMEILEILSLLSCLSEQFAQVRMHLRTLGELADVPIEPTTQTMLLDKTCDLPGVLFAGVPGAGGYDAIFSIILDGNANIASRHVLELWADASKVTNTNTGEIKQLPVKVVNNQGIVIQSSQANKELIDTYTSGGSGASTTVNTTTTDATTTTTVTEAPATPTSSSSTTTTTTTTDVDVSVDTSSTKTTPTSLTQYFYNVIFMQPESSLNSVVKAIGAGAVALGVVGYTMGIFGNKNKQ